MSISTFLYEAISSHGYFFTWRDALEILCLTTAIYYFSLWLTKDRQKNLLPAFYGYCLLLCFAYNAQLTTLSQLMLLFSPMIGTIFFLLHQQTLQRNFIALRNVQPARAQNDDWLETLIQTALIALNNKKEILCVIERHDSLQEVINTPLTLHANLKKGLLDILLDSQSFNHQQMLWLNAQGIVLGMNAQWSTLPILTTDEQGSEEISWKDAALFFSAKTDAIIIKTNAHKRSFDVVVYGKTYDNVTASNIIPVLKKYLMQAHTAQGVDHASIRKKEYPQQPNA